MYSTWVDMPKAPNPYTRFFSSLWFSKATIKELSIVLQTTNRNMHDILPQKVLLQENFQQLLTQLHWDIDQQLSSLSLYPDFLPAVEVLKEKWYELAVVSNLSKPYTFPLTHLLQKDIFDYKILSFEVWIKKPDIWIFQKLQCISWLHTDDIVMVGDSLLSDVQWAKHAGIDPIHIDRTSEWIQYHGEYISISTLMQLLEVL